mgnify:CR=1 FL=1
MRAHLLGSSRMPVFWFLPQYAASNTPRHLCARKGRPDGYSVAYCQAGYEILNKYKIRKYEIAYENSR